MNNKPMTGWRMMGDKKVFVARTHAGTQIAEGAEGFKLSMAFSRKSSAKGKGKGSKASENGKKTKKR